MYKKVVLILKSVFFLKRNNIKLLEIIHDFLPSNSGEKKGTQK